MILPVVRIGNSKGIRLPKAVLQQCDIDDEVDVEVNGEILTITPHKHPRKGWDAQMAKMHERGEDQLLVSDSIDSDFDGWEWK